MRRSASRSSAAVIRSNSRWRRTSEALYASGAMTNPSTDFVLVALVGARPGRPLEPAEGLAVAGRLDAPVAWLALVGLGRLRVGHRRRRQVVRQRHAPAPEPVEGPVVRLALVAAAHEDGRSGRPDLLPVADVDEGQGPGEVDRRPEVHAEPDRAQRPPEHDRLAEQPAAIDVGSATARPAQPPAATSSR